MTYSASEVAKKLELSKDTLRYYEKEGLIPPYVSLLVNSGGESIPERRDLLLEHKTFLMEKILTYQNLLHLIEKKNGGGRWTV